MLIVTRRVGTSVRISVPRKTDFSVTVISIDGQQVKLGFDAPRHVAIVRDDAKDKGPRNHLKLPDEDESSDEDEPPDVKAPL